VTQRQCLLHIGLHKTGSTSIQRALSEGAEQLLALGWLYPLAGRIVERSGQHNLAWELTHDLRRRIAFGSIDDLWTEVADRPESVIISSEDFEGCVGHPAEFAAFIAGLQGAGLAPTVVMYVRDQADALVRNYLQKVLHGMDLSFNEVLAQVLAEGRYTWREWIVNFDYTALAHWLGDMGVAVRVRSYEAAPDGVVGDFLSRIGLSLADLGLEREPRANPAFTLAYYMAAYSQNRLGRETYEAREASLTPPGLAAATIAISPQTRRTIRARFAESNRRLAEEYGATVPSAEPDAPGSGLSATYVDELFGAIA